MLWDQVFSICDQDLLFQSRIHLLPTFAHSDCQVFVKREDESGFGISGCKKRKYASLIPFLKKEKYERVSLIGGRNSNHIAGFSQLLRENRIPFHLFLRQTSEALKGKLEGNSLLTNLLTQPDQITWVENQQWFEVENLAKHAFPQTHHFVVPEGGSCEAALPGAMTLMHDIIRSETQIGQAFDHIFIDSGTALIAGALVMMNQILDRKSQIHVVLMADDTDYFHQRLELFGQWYENLFHRKTPEINQFTTHFPGTARSFGSVNASVLKETRRLAMEEGLITDPVYTTKLFMTAREVIHRDHLQGRILIIHSGGGTGLMGFGERF